MKHISILVPRGHSSLSNIEGCHHMFSEVNGIRQEMGLPPVFEIEMVGVDKKVMQRNGTFTITTQRLIDEVEKTDLIIIPAVHGDPLEVIEDNSAFLPWIINQHRRGAEVASLCIGAFLLAATGLVDGKQCATHWRFTQLLKHMFPAVHAIDYKIVTEEEGIYTSGGAYSYLNLIVYLVEKYAGREVAIVLAKAFMIDMDKNSQSPFIIFHGQKSHEDRSILQAQEFIEKNFHEKITVDAIADKLALGRRSLERRFKHATSNTISEYIQRVKIEAAKKQLEAGRKTVSEVMYEVGYSDMKAFRMAFKKCAGLSPLEYKNKYNRTASVA